MPLSISTDAITAKNSLGNSSPWLLLLKIAYPTETPIYLVWNTENITWDGQTWTAANFTLGDVEESSDGSIPGVNLTVWDLTRSITQHLDDYDGGVGATVYIYILHSSTLTDSPAAAELELEFSIISVSIDSMNRITFSLGAENPTRYRCPPERYLKGHCRYKEFGGDLCKYSGIETACNRTFTQCQSYSNEANFGGFPGVGSLGYYR